MKKFLVWLVLSSQNPQKVSLTVKSFLTAATTYIVFFAGILHFNIGASDVAIAIDNIVKVISDILMVISSAATAWAFIRKIGTTLNGTNKVINTGTTL